MTKVVEAETFVVKDSNGRKRGLFGMQGEEPVLILYDEGEQARIVLRITAEHVGGKLIKDEAGERVELALTAGSEAIALFDRNGKPQLTVLGMPHGISFYAYDPKPQVRLRIDVREGASGFSIYDRSGGMRGTLGILDEEPMVLLWDANREEIVRLDSHSGADSISQDPSLS